MDQETNFRIRQQDLEKAVNHAALVVLIDLQGKIVQANENFCRSTGYDPSDLPGRNLLMIRSGLHPPDFWHRIWETVSSGRIWRGTINHLSREKKLLWWDTTVSPCFDSLGKPEYYLSVSYDLTEQKGREENLRFFADAIEGTADSIFITDRSGKILYVNAAFETITGFPREEALGKTPRLLKSGVHNENQYKNFWETILSGGIFQDTFLNRKKNGELFHAQETVTAIRDGEGRIVKFVSVIKDLTEQIRKQEHDIEMHYASLVQKKLYPESFPRISGLDIAGTVIPAEAIGGDYLDYFQLSDRLLRLVIGDVSGHGLGPALIMAETRAYLRMLTKSCPEVVEIFSTVNQSLWEDLEPERFVTLQLVQIDMELHQLHYLNAGHIPGYLLDREGTVKAVLDSTGFPLGMFPDQKWTCSGHALLAPGDILVLLTDGVTESEAADGRFFEAERALEVIRSHRHLPAETIVNQLVQAVEVFIGNRDRQDDLTLVVCKILAGPEPSPSSMPQET